MKVKLISLISIFIFTVCVFININTTYTYAAEDGKKSSLFEIFGFQKITPSSKTDSEPSSEQGTESSSQKGTGSGISEIFTGAKNFMDADKDSSSELNQDNLSQTSGMIFNILLSIGFVAAIIVSAILGIKFMLGSVEEKAQVKDALIPFIIGCIVIFGAFGIWKIFVTIGRNL